MANIRSYRELRVYQAAREAAMIIFKLTQTYPPEEKYAMKVKRKRRASGLSSLYFANTLTKLNSKISTTDMIKFSDNW